MVISPHQVCTEWLLPPLPCVGGALCYSICCSLAIPSIWWGIQLLGLGRESLDPSTFHAWWGGVFFPRFGSIWWHGGLRICDGIKPGDSGVVIGYKVDEFTHTWSAEWFVAYSHIYPGFTGMVSSLNLFPLELGCEDYSFWIRLLLTLNKSWIPSSLIPLRHQNWMLAWMSLMPFHLQSLLGFFAQLVLFLVIPNCSMVLA